MLDILYWDAQVLYGYLKKCCISIRVYQQRVEMIKKQSNYYYTVSDQPQNSVPLEAQQDTIEKKPVIPLQIRGNIKQYLKHVSAEVAKIKELKKKQKEQEMANKLVLDGLLGVTNQVKVDNNGSVRLQVRVPQQLYEIDQRISKLQQKILNDQIMRQKLQRKGKLSQRSKHLLTQLQKLSQKGMDHLSTPITNFSKNLDQKEQNHKILFLYETFTKTHSLNEQIQMLDVYLKNLNQIVRKYQALVSADSVVEVHQKVLIARERNAKKVREMYQWMVAEYEKLVKDIDAL